MFVTLVRAAETGRIPLTLAQASAQVLPPLPLYRRLLRAHRRLPAEMRFMGDAYIKSEFRATRSTDNPLHVMAFLSQWKRYLDELEPALKDEDGSLWRGRKLETETMDQLSQEQVGQLYELMHATGEVWKSPEELEKAALAAEAAAAEAKPEDK